MAALVQSHRSSFRGFYCVVTASVVSAALLVSPCQAAQAQPDPARAAPQTFPGRLNADALVYSGAGNQFYATTRLPKGADVEVAGMTNKTWLLIVPPEGSFSLVPKYRVNTHGDVSGGVRRGVVNEQVTVRAGSSVSALVSTVQVKLEANDQVAVIGEQNEYFKIKPPKGVYLFIQKDYVERVLTQPGTGPQKSTPPPTPAGNEVGTRGPATGPASPQPELAIAPSTRPVVSAELLGQLQKLETDFAEMSTKPLLDQPVPEMMAAYEKIAATPGLPEMAKRVADVRLATLRVRADAREQFAGAQKRQQEYMDRLKAQQVEKQEIEQRIKDIDIQVYAAVGTLRTSSLQVSKTTLYRLTDPETKGTVVYVWGTDPKTADLVGKFVGIKGPMQSDARLNLKVVTPTALDVVDPAKVNTSVAAEIVPPSLLPKAGPRLAGALTPGNP